MPTYQYRCKSCSHEFEEVQKFADDALITCPSCKSNSLVRVIGGSGLVFKGSGFYQTDYRNTSNKEEKPAAPSKPETKTDKSETAKPAESPAAKPKKDSPPPKDK